MRETHKSIIILNPSRIRMEGMDSCTSPMSGGVTLQLLASRRILETDTVGVILMWSVTKLMNSLNLTVLENRLSLTRITSVRFLDNPLY